MNVALRRSQPDRSEAHAQHLAGSNSGSPSREARRGRAGSDARASRSWAARVAVPATAARQARKRRPGSSGRATSDWTFRRTPAGASRLGNWESGTGTGKQPRNRKQFRRRGETAGHASGGSRKRASAKGDSQKQHDGTCGGSDSAADAAQSPRSARLRRQKSAGAIPQELQPGEHTLIASARRRKGRHGREAIPGRGSLGRREVG